MPTPADEAIAQPGVPTAREEGWPGFIGDWARSLSAGFALLPALRPALTDLSHLCTCSAVPDAVPNCKAARRDISDNNQFDSMTRTQPDIPTDNRGWLRPIARLLALPSTPLSLGPDTFGSIQFHMERSGSHWLVKRQGHAG